MEYRPFSGLSLSRIGIACGSCAQVCPQSIDIPAVMKKFDEAITARKK